MFDTWSYLSSSGDQNHLHAKPHPRAREDESPECRRTDSAASGTISSAEDHRNAASMNMDEAGENFRKDWILAAWMDICTLHMVGMASLLLMLIPSIANQSMLACNAIPQVNASAWPVLNSGLCILGISWTWCCAMHFWLGLPRLALCTAMHSVARIMLAYACTAVSCPLPPIFMPGAVASGMGVFVGVQLLCISHMHSSRQEVTGEGKMQVQIFDTAEFYMNHAWACAVVLFGIRHLAFRGVVWMHGCFFRHAVQG